ncbi:hypothetical protein ACFVZ3_22120 [Kitasatospora purpeofusca]|uniref:hypothetical protein n=1 Tax=Kitasatospora purpeofusca TaxID=67352 RepID=UPI00367ED2DF
MADHGSPEEPSSNIRITGTPEVARAAIAALSASTALTVVRVSQPAKGDRAGEIRQYVRVRTPRPARTQ